MQLLKCSLDLQPFWTVITGVIVFVLSQLFIEFVLRPIQEYKILKSEIAWALVYYGNVCNSGGAKQELYDDASQRFRELAAETRAYKIKKPKGICDRDKLETVAKHLIGLSNSIGQNVDDEFIRENLYRIKEALNLEE